MSEIIAKSISKEDKIIGNLKNQFIRTSLNGQQRVKISAKEVSGNIALAYYRGMSVGEEDRTKQIIRILKSEFPKASEFIKKRYFTTSQTK